MRWIEEHYREEISLETLAEETHLSKFYVSRIFREETGSSITDYLTARRIKQACRLLQTTDLSVEQIGIRVGYPNASYFIQLFKKVVGVTPLKYRNKYVV
jgi:YesN/AraC family two-component response regulator